MSNRTLVVDCSYLLKRSYEGVKDAYDSRGSHIGAIYGFYNTLRKLIKEHQRNKVILIWDGEGGGFERYLIDPAYKANRKNKSWSTKIELTDEQIRLEELKSQSLLKQRKRIQSYAEELFLRQIECDRVEADDLIAQYCMDHYQTEDIIIFTNDRDFLQLLDLNITIIFGNIDHPINKSNFFFQFGYHFSNALLMKIISGDVSDNIKGIDGIKEPTLLKHFPELQFKHFMVRDICIKSDELNKERIKLKKKPLKALETLINNVARLKTNYLLMNLREPFLTEEAIDELGQLELPLLEDGRSSKNLFKLMQEDDFLLVNNNSFVNYVEPFYTVIMHEKDLLKEYNKKQIN